MVDSTRAHLLQDGRPDLNTSEPTSDKFHHGELASLHPCLEGGTLLGNSNGFRPFQKVSLFLEFSQCRVLPRV